MTDIFCAVCGEPWNAYGVRHHMDMTHEEALRFLKGDGCPCCGFGTYCPTCLGTGKYTSYFSQTGDRHCCTNGQVFAWSVDNDDEPPYKSGEIYMGYTPSVKHVPDPVIVRPDGYRYSHVGRVDQYIIVCPTCHGEGEHLDPCSRCDGTGDVGADPDLALRAAESHIDASDEEPIGILVKRGLL